MSHGIDGFISFHLFLKSRCLMGILEQLKKTNKNKENQTKTNQNNKNNNLHSYVKICWRHAKRSKGMCGREVKCRLCLRIMVVEQDANAASPTTRPMARRGAMRAARWTTTPRIAQGQLQLPERLQADR